MAEIAVKFAAFSIGAAVVGSALWAGGALAPWSVVRPLTIGGYLGVVIAFFVWRATR